MLWAQMLNPKHGLAKIGTRLATGMQGALRLKLNKNTNDLKLLSSLAVFNDFLASWKCLIPTSILSLAD